MNGYIKLLSAFGTGYMFKSIIVTMGTTTENMTVNLILFTCCLIITGGYKLPVAIIAFTDWLGQQDETLVECYEKRLKLWGLV